MNILLFGNFTWGPVYKHGLTLIPAWISNCTHYELWDEIAYLFSKVEVCDWISNFIPRVAIYVIVNQFCQ